MKDFNQEMHPTRRLYFENVVLFPLTWCGYKIAGQLARALGKYDTAEEYSKRANRLAETPIYIFRRMKASEVLKAKIPPLNPENYDHDRISYQTKIAKWVTKK